MGIKAQSRLIAGAPDYEAGTWTPTLGVVSGTDGTHTYGQQVAHYARVGGLVWVAATISISTLDVTMSGDITVKGLPFATGTPTVAPEFVVTALSGITLNTAGGYTTFTGSLRVGASDVAIRQTGSNVLRVNVASTAVASACGLSITGVYRAA